MVKRIIKYIDNDNFHKDVIFICGLHGNEPNTISGLEKAFKIIEDQNIEIKGRILAIKGNLKAIEQNKRFIDIDLNRVWDKSSQNLKALIQAENHEFIEHQEMLNCIKMFSKLNCDFTTIVDFHTASSETVPFVVTGIQESSRALIKKLNLPCIWNSFSNIEGVMIDYFQKNKIETIAIEAGSHHDKNVVAIIAYLTLRVLKIKGVIDYFPKPPLMMKELQLPNQFLQMKYVHKISVQDKFELNKGFKNFDEVTKDQFLGNDQNGRVLCPMNGYIFMPLYQINGDYGFCIVH